MRKLVKLFTMLLVFGLFLSIPCLAEAKSPSRSVCTDSGWEALKEINELRLKRGLVPLSMSERMYSGTKVRAKELSKKFSHIRPNGNSYKTVFANRRYVLNAKESITRGVTDEVSAVKALKRLSADKRNMVSKKAKHVSFAYSKGNAVAMYSECDCSHTIKVKGSKSVKEVPFGTSVNDLGLVLQVSCKHGKGYVPVMSGMVSKYNKNAYGRQTVTIKWNGLKTTQKIKVVKRNLSDAKIIDAPFSVVYYGSPCTLEGKYTVMYKGKALKAGRDYTVSYKNNTAPGTATLILTGKGSYKGKLVYKFYCAKFEIINEVRY